VGDGAQREARGYTQRKLAQRVVAPAEEGDAVTSCKGHKSAVTAMALSRDGGTAFSCSKDGAIFKCASRVSRCVRLVSWPLPPHVAHPPPPDSLKANQPTTNGLVPIAQTTGTIGTQHTREHTPEYNARFPAVRTHVRTHARTYRYTVVHHYRYAHVHHFRCAHADES
jgi:hypothetical protein